MWYMPQYSDCDSNQHLKIVYSPKYGTRKFMNNPKEKQ